MVFFVDGAEVAAVDVPPQELLPVFTVGRTSEGDGVWDSVWISRIWGAGGGPYQISRFEVPPNEMRDLQVVAPVHSWFLRF